MDQYYAFDPRPAMTQEPALNPGSLGNDESIDNYASMFQLYLAPEIAKIEEAPLFPSSSSLPLHPNLLSSSFLRESVAANQSEEGQSPPFDIPVSSIASSSTSPHPHPTNQIGTNPLEQTFSIPGSPFYLSPPSASGSGSASGFGSGAEDSFDSPASFSDLNIGGEMGDVDLGNEIIINLRDQMRRESDHLQQVQPHSQEDGSTGTVGGQILHVKEAEPVEADFSNDTRERSPKDTDNGNEGSQSESGDDDDDDDQCEVLEGSDSSHTRDTNENSSRIGDLTHRRSGTKHARNMEEDEDVKPDRRTLSDSAELRLDHDREAGGAQRTKKRTKSVYAFATSTLRQSAANSALPPVPDWTDKPDKDQYRKMSSKEKRQMRNKISARNFRHRKKEYITTLEEEISSRDSLIVKLRDEVGVMRESNQSLQGEVNLLKMKWDEMMAKMTSANTENGGHHHTTMGMVGLGNSSNPIAVAGLTSPKAVLVDLPSVTTATPATDGREVKESESPLTSTTTSLPFSNQNFNPALNNLSASQISQLPSLTSHLRPGFSGTMGGSGGIQTPFFDSNPFCLKPEHVEEYRSQLYGKMAHNMAGFQAAQKMVKSLPASAAAAAAGSSTKSGSGSGVSTGYLPIPNGFRPTFFTGGNSTLNGISSKSSSSSIANDASTASDRKTAEIAQLASATLLSRLSAAVIEALSASSAADMPGSSLSLTEGMKMMSSSKVAAVLSGKAKLQFCPTPTAANAMTSESVTATSSVQKEVKPQDMDELDSRMRKVELGPGTILGLESGKTSCSFDEVCYRWRRRT